MSWTYCDVFVWNCSLMLIAAMLVSLFFLFLNCLKIFKLFVFYLCACHPAWKCIHIWLIGRCLSSYSYRKWRKLTHSLALLGHGNPVPLFLFVAICFCPPQIFSHLLLLTSFQSAENSRHLLLGLHDGVWNLQIWRGPIKLRSLGFDDVHYCWVGCRSVYSPDLFFSLFMRCLIENPQIFSIKDGELIFSILKLHYRSMHHIVVLDRLFYYIVWSKFLSIPGSSLNKK